MKVDIAQIKKDRANGVIVSLQTWDALVAYASELEIQSEAAKDVLAERQRQLYVEGFHAARDDQYVKGELGLAASAYACTASPDMHLDWIPGNWPWGANWYKPKSRRQNMVKAGALILAEIERLDRVEKKG